MPGRESIRPLNGARYLRLARQKGAGADLKLWQVCILAMFCPSAPTYIEWSLVRLIHGVCRLAIGFQTGSSSLSNVCSVRMKASHFRGWGSSISSSSPINSLVQNLCESRRDCLTCMHSVASYEACRQMIRQRLLLSMSLQMRAPIPPTDTI